MQRSTVARRGVLALAILAVVWACVVALTGGFHIHAAGIRISSRNILNPLLAAFAAGCCAIALAGAARRRALTEDLRWWWAGITAAHDAILSVWWARWVNATVIAAMGGASLLLYRWARGSSLWLDEEMIALNIRDRYLMELGQPLWLDQSAPIGWLATERLATLVFGIDETGIRFVPVLFGLATIVAAAWVGRRWMTAAGAVTLVVLSSLGQWVFHYSVQLKHYSGDVFFGLMLPALVAWVVEADDVHHRRRRAAIWWVIAALGQWWAYGALFVTPAAAVVLWILLWRMDGWRSAAWFSVFGIGWLASFAINYWAALRFTVASVFLRQYWSVALPPATAGPTEIAKWLVGRVAPFAEQPGGTELVILFWATALCGILFARRPVLRYVCAAVPVSACVLAAIRLVPLAERLALWAVPAIYVAIALCLDAGVRWARDGWRQAQYARVVVAGLMLVAGLWLCLDIARRGWRDVDGLPDKNYLTDDRTGVRWLLAQRRPGDAVLTTPLALPAIWWYGPAAISAPVAGGSLPDGTPVLTVSYHRPPGRDCDDDAFRRTLARHQRVLVYFGFRFDDVPGGGFDALLIRELERIGDVTEFRPFAGITRAAVLQIDPVRGSSGDAGSSHATHPDGCVSVRPAIRW